MHPNYQLMPGVVGDNLPGLRFTKIYSRLGIVQVIIAVLSISLSTTTVVMEHNLQGYSINMGSGIWCGTLFLVSGVFCIVSGKKPSHCWITTGLVLAILSAVFAAAMASFEVTCALYNGASGRLSTDVDITDILVVLHAVLGCLGTVDIIIACIYAGYCCPALCCSRQHMSYEDGNVQVCTVLQNGSVSRTNLESRTHLETEKDLSYGQDMENSVSI
ncbi:membrane-spanning 4-domains subfamily A member 4A-like [Ciona intestinalis]